MDDLQCEGQVVDQTLRELEIINRLLGGNNVTIDGIARLLQSRNQQQVIHITDMGCGGGDILKLVAQWARRNNIPMKLTGIDANPNIIAYAERNSAAYPEISYKAINIFSDDFKEHETDIILATLFTHHFTEDELVYLVAQWHHQARVGVVINDIHRHWFAYYSIKWLTRIFSQSAMVRFDAPLSVLRSFRKQELQTILKRASITNYTLKWKWAFRWQLITPSA